MLLPTPVDSAIVATADRLILSSSSRVHLALLLCSVVLATFCAVSAPPGTMHAALPLLLTVLLLTGPLLVPAALLHERKAWERRDAVLMLPWTLLVALLITLAAPISATYAYPLRDSLWRNWDLHLGINIPAIIDFGRHHPGIGGVLSSAYAYALHPLILCAIFLPVIAGKREVAQRFVLVNAFSFVWALPCITMLPAVGPWVGWHFPPDQMQQHCQNAIYTLRRGSLVLDDIFGGIVCLPSFHTFWAVASAHALYSFRWLRYPAIVAAILITLSTMTTGWHYGVDVIAALVMMAICTGLSNFVIYGRFCGAFHSVA